jgi:ribokinase
VAGPSQGVAILGVFVADLTFRAARMPSVGETIIGSGFAMGPGGKGSNQAVAAARAGAAVTFVSKIGRDAFADVALATWEKEGIRTRVELSDTHPTGAAFIYVNEIDGENAIIVEVGAAATISRADVEAAKDVITGAKVFMTQLEQPAEAAGHGLAIARAAGVVTVFNPAPAPAAPIDESIYALCDFITPNELEAKTITGIAVETVDDARRAGDILLGKGAGTAVITLGEKGALFHTASRSLVVPAFVAGSAVETAGAGDAFNGAFAAALAGGDTPMDAARFGCVAAGISVTRHGTAPSMPTLAEIRRGSARQ